MSSLELSHRPHWIREDFIDFVAGVVNPMWTWQRPMGRITAIDPLPDDMVQISVRPNRHFNRTGIKPGQFVMVTLPIEGVRQQRAYSLVSSPGSRELVFGIKRQGRVSRYLADHAKVGEVIELSQASGDFILDSKPSPKLFVAAGSGITPMIPLIRQALSTGNHVTLIYYSRDPVYRDELETMAREHERFQLHLIIDSSQAPSVFDGAALDRMCPKADLCETYVCASPGLMMATRRLWAERGWADRLRQERFTPVAMDDNASSVPVTFRRSQRDFEARGNLLASAEAAGLRPAFGCRMGICNTCACQKISGSVRNLNTGEINDQVCSQIKLCISEALSPLEIDL